MDAITPLYQPGLGRVLKLVRMNRSFSSRALTLDALKELMEHTEAFEIGTLIRDLAKCRDSALDEWIDGCKTSFQERISSISSELLLCQTHSGMVLRYGELVTQKASLCAGAGLFSQAIDELVLAKSWTFRATDSTVIDLQLAKLCVEYLAWNDALSLGSFKQATLAELLPVVEPQGPLKSPEGSALRLLCGIAMFAQANFEAAFTLLSQTCNDAAASGLPLDYFTVEDVAAMRLLAGMAVPRASTKEPTASNSPAFDLFHEMLANAKFLKAVSELHSMVAELEGRAFVFESLAAATQKVKESILCKIFIVYKRMSLDNLGKVIQLSRDSLLDSLIRLIQRGDLNARIDLQENTVYLVQTDLRPALCERVSLTSQRLRDTVDQLDYLTRYQNEFNRAS